MREALIWLSLDHDDIAPVFFDPIRLISLVKIEKQAGFELIAQLPLYQTMNTFCKSRYDLSALFPAFPGLQASIQAFASAKKSNLSIITMVDHYGNFIEATVEQKVLSVLITCFADAVKRDSQYLETGTPSAAAINKFVTGAGMVLCLGTIGTSPFVASFQVLVAAAYESFTSTTVDLVKAADKPASLLSNKSIVNWYNNFTRILKNQLGHTAFTQHLPDVTRIAKLFNHFHYESGEALQVYRVPADNNCFWHAVYHQLKISFKDFGPDFLNSYLGIKNASQMRQVITEFMCQPEQQDALRFVLGDDFFSETLTEVSTDKHWCGEASMLVVLQYLESKSVSCQFTVVQNNPDRPVHQVFLDSATDDDRVNLCLAYNDTHYDSVIQKGGTAVDTSTANRFAASASHYKDHVCDNSWKEHIFHYPKADVVCVKPSPHLHLTRAATAFRGAGAEASVEDVGLDLETPKA